MIYNKIKKLCAVALAASIGVTSLPDSDYFSYATAAITAEERDESAKRVSLVGNTDISEDDKGVFKVTVDESGDITAGGSEFDPDGEYASDEDTPFSWDNVNMYFVLTDRFKNGDDSNDHSYGRSATSSTIPAAYKSTFETVAGAYAGTGEKNASGYAGRVGTFHGGDLKGLTEYIENGYFDALGTNAIWISAPYEQIHGAMTGNQFKHYAYHGYYVLDYTNVDANMGTAEDLKTFVTTAHEHGIRVVFDVVMNHAGYADPYTIAEYYGTDASVLNSNWREVYYNTDEKSYKWYNDYSAYGQSNGSGSFNPNGWTDIFWTNSWVRNVEKNDDGTERFAGCGGAESGSDTTLCSGGLPDFKTESHETVGLPDILKKKWEKEGVLSAKQAQIDSMFQRTGLQRDVTGYLVGWLSEWVKDYGIDGFRCDTAKHVDKSEWKKLYTACNEALKQWRKENSDEPGAQWNDEFWMTGEAWGWSSLSADSYFTDGGFTSMINFGYQGKENAKGSALETTFSSYANAINNAPGFNVLSYISSHDKGLGARSASAGTALLLTPGGVQTFYGDESGRQAGSGNDYEPARSHMNLDDLNQSILSNWQKVGQFRKNHIAVGAGQHKKIVDSPYTFSRIYTGKATVGSDTKTDYEDKVVVSLPGSAGTYDVDVSSVFEDGTALTDEYSGEVYTVSGGKVSVICDSNGVILLGAGGVAKSSIGATASQSFTSDTLTIKFSATKTSDSYYILDDGEKVAFSAGDTIEIGGGDPTGTIYTIVVGGTSEEGEELSEKTYTYSKEEKPEYTFYLRTKASDYGFTPYIYLYGTDAAQTAYTGKWPGTAMTKEGDYYVYYSTEFSSANVIINDNGTWQDPVKDTDMVCTGYMEYTYKSGKLTAFTPTVSIATKAPVVTKKPTVKETEKPKETEGVKETSSPKETDKPKSTTAVKATSTPKATATAKVTTTKKPTVTATPTVTQKPQSGANTQSSSVDNSVASSDFAITSFTSNKAAPQETGSKIVLTLKGTGGSGKYTYKFYIINSETLHQEIYTGWTSTNKVTWIPSEGGKYKIRAYICDDGAAGKEIKNVTVDYQITSALTVKNFKATKLTKRKVKFTMKAEGKGNVQYKLMTVSATGKKTTIKKYSTSRTKTYTFKQAGTYTVYLYVKDGNNMVKKVKKVLQIK